MHPSGSDACLWERAPGKLLLPSFRERVVEFFETHLPATSHLGDANADIEGEDLVQEVYVRLLTEDRGVHGIAAHVLRDDESRLQIERAHIAERYEESCHGCLGAHVDPERLLLITEAVEQVVAVVMRLPERMRDIWVLRYLKEMSAAEIAAQLRIDETTARDNLYRVREYLSKYRAITFTC